MATDFTTTRLCAVEAPIRMLEPFALRFVDLLNVWLEHICAEQALERIDSSYRDYQRRLDEADAASLQLYDVLAEITALPAPDAMSVPLRRMAMIVAVLVREGTASAFRRYVARKPEFDAWLAVPGCGPVAARIRHMLAAADKRIALMARLTFYRRDGVDLGAETRAEPARLAA